MADYDICMKCNQPYEDKFVRPFCEDCDKKSEIIA